MSQRREFPAIRKIVETKLENQEIDEATQQAVQVIGTTLQQAAEALYDATSRTADAIKVIKQSAEGANWNVTTEFKLHFSLDKIKEAVVDLQIQISLANSTSVEVREP